MKKTFLAIALLAAVPSTSLAADAVFEGEAEDNPLKTTFNLYPLVEDFQWKEWAGGTRLLKESGTLYGAGGAAVFEKGSAVYRLGGDYFRGKVDYVGSTWGGTPVTTNVDYEGFRVDGDAGVKFAGRRLSWEPFWGLGYRWWRRDLKSTSVATGYVEKWETLYLKVGARAELDLGGGIVPFAEAAGRYHVLNEVAADFGVAKVSLDPGSQASLYAEAGLRIRLLFASAYYEELNFSESDPVAAPGALGLPPGAALFQPKSKGRVLGGRVGISF